jgi:hypothetical protein
MARICLSAIILAAFFLRDLRLLASAGPIRSARACGIYSVFSGIYAALLAIGFRVAGIRRPDLISLGRNEWAGLVAIHLVLWGVTSLLSRTSLRNRAWLLALAPSPATLLSQCLLVALLPENMANALGLFSIFLFSVTWNALMIPFAYELSQGAFWNRFASARSLILVGCLNLFCFLYFLDPARRSVELGLR